MIRVMIVDDHQLVRAGLRSIIEAPGDLAVVAEAQSGEEAVAQAQQGLAVDVVLMDLNMPGGMGGIEATRRLARVVPQARIVALSALSDEPLPTQVHDAGAVGYLTKGCPAKELLDAIRAVHRGLPYVDAKLAQRRMVANWRGTKETPFADLSAREMQVTLMILDGRRNHEIADCLSLSQKTVSTYRQRIFEKLDIGTDVELTRLAYRHGLIQEMAP
ncbi:response regulator [Thiohalocapsa sp.]|uniref:response regulator n=1 Tax=Thiohalocapsa sp. TaxID=2497641 RepID=UPI0025E39D6E|nr:response regulator [Thiohalocapsa sp.]